jgi:4'-phosphopantetheinyl transferase
MQLLSLHYTDIPRHPCPELDARVLPLLPAARRDAVARKREAVDRNATLLGVALLARGCAQLGRAFDGRQLQFPASGKPMLAGGPEFSISHAAGLVACLVDLESPVGIDLEDRMAARWEDIAFVLGAAECERLQRERWQPSGAWVAIEAVLKAAGLGLAAVSKVRLEGDRASVDGEYFHLRAIELSDRHVACVARRDGPVVGVLEAIRHSLPAAMIGLPASSDGAVSLEGDQDG